MDLPDPLGAAAAFAAFVRARLADLADLGGSVGASVGPIATRWTRPDEVRDAVQDVAMVIVGAAAPFAPTSYARARLLRQLHATGLLTEDESDRAVELLEIAR